jgi:hypothetical protein
METVCTRPITLGTTAGAITLQRRAGSEVTVSPMIFWPQFQEDISPPNVLEYGLKLKLTTSLRKQKSRTGRFVKPKYDTMESDGTNFKIRAIKNTN